jgi:hypothetical protein
MPIIAEWVNKSTALFGTGSFINVLKEASYWSLPQSRLITLTRLHITHLRHFNIIPSSTLAPMPF